MTEGQPNQKDIIGFSFNDEIAKNKWIELIHFINKYLIENNLQETIVFHGTSSEREDDIIAHGLFAGDITHAISEGSIDDTGSFWGDIYTASAYAEDTVAERDPGSHPVLLLSFTSYFENDYTLLPDLATYDFPLKGLTKLDDNEELSNDWMNNHKLKTWRHSLNELGAIVVVHDDPLDNEYFHIIKNKDDFINVLENNFSNEPVLSQAI